MGNNVLVISRDITKQKQIEENLRASEARYRSVVEDQTELIARWKPDGTLTFVNKAVCSFIGLEYEQLIGLNFNLILQPIKEDEDSKLFSSLDAITPENPIAQGQTQVLVTPGKPRWLEWRTRAIFDENGQVTEFQTVANDITDIKRPRMNSAIAKLATAAWSRYRMNSLAGSNRMGPSHSSTKLLNVCLEFRQKLLSGIVSLSSCPKSVRCWPKEQQLTQDILTPQNPSITDNLRCNSS